MSFSSYTDLKTSVQAWLVRGDSLVTDRIPDFIRLGEERIGRRLRVSGMVSLPTTLTILAGQNWVALPDDWLAFKRIRSAAEPRIEYMTPDALEDLPPCGDASKYSIEGRRLLYGQTPSANLALTVRYYQRPPYLQNAASTWLLNEAPSVYLYAALVEGAMFIKNSGKAGEWGTLFDKAVDELQSVDEAAAVSGSNLRMRRR
ncbi:phage adaptor protein [Variovorax sp. ZT5P49]|uniref:phage adaptor protein n=1 Tax=Variovorax sp. ZT5P49 TaxID=3443733 RepID=UPI003F46353F